MQRFYSFPGTRDSRNKSFVTVVLLLGGLIAACVSAQLILADDWKTPGLIAPGFACLVFAVKSSNNWRKRPYLFNGLAEQPIVPSMNSVDPGGATSASHHEG